MRATIVLVTLLLLGIGAFLFSRAGGIEVLGPVDGLDLPATEVTRVALGTEAPDFALDSYAGTVVRLSDYRGRKDVVLVFYRGHW
jgi:hypothetical protein